MLQHTPQNDVDNFGIPVAVLGYDVAQKLFPEGGNPVGQQIKDATFT